MTDKAQLRQTIRQRKKSFSTAALAKLSSDIVAELEANDHFRDAEVVLMYDALPDEVQTAAFIEKWYKKKTVLLPKVAGENLTLHIYKGKAYMETGAFHIPEPTTPPFLQYSSIDLAVVPGMAFDRKGHRLGRGKGYYDRLFSTMLPQKPFKIGLAFPFQIVDEVPVEPTDVSMDALVY
jgi:5-formyltetrahydrofolate cyclo-ligase